MQTAAPALRHQSWTLSRHCDVLVQASSALLCLLLAAISAVQAQMDYNYPTLWNTAALEKTTVTFLHVLRGWLVYILIVSSTYTPFYISAGALQGWRRKSQGNFTTTTMKLLHHVLTGKHALTSMPS